MEERARNQLEELDAQLAATAGAIAAMPAPEDTAPQRLVQFRHNGQPKTNAAQLLMQYADARVHAVVLRGICKLAQALQGAVARTVKQLRDMRRELDRIGEAFDMLASRSTPHDRKSKPREVGQRESIAESLQRRMPELVARLDANLQQEFIGPCGGFAAVLTGNVDHRARLPAALRSAARSVVRPALREIDVAQLVLPSANGSDPMSTQLKAWLEAATPRLLQCGGRRRFMVVLPAGSPATQLAEQVAAQVGATPSLVVDPDVDAAIFCEAENLLLTDVATSLVEGRPDLVEVAARLHTRVDANWSKLEDVDAER
jgi:hypothetical protein